MDPLITPASSHEVHYQLLHQLRADFMPLAHPERLTRYRHRLRPTASPAHITDRIIYAHQHSMYRIN